MIIECLDVSPERVTEIEESQGEPVRNPSAKNGIHALLREISRAPVDILWIPWDTLEPAGAAGIDAVRRFRVSRAETRIVIEIPDDLSPPQPLLGQCVSLGIVDFVPVSLPFQDALDRHPTYADVARWQGGVTAWDEDETTGSSVQIKTEKVIEVREKVIERKIASTNRPAVIVIRGLVPGSGVTLLSLGIGLWLARHGFPAAVLEAGPGPSALTRYASRADSLPVGLSLYPSGTQNLADLIQSRSAAYIVLDVGSGPNRPKLGLLPDQEIILVPPPTRWSQIPGLEHPETYLPTRNGLRMAQSWEVGQPGQRVLWLPLGSALTPEELAVVGHTLPLPGMSFPPILSKELDRTLGTLLAPVRPDVSVPPWKIGLKTLSRWAERHHEGIIKAGFAVSGLFVLALFAHAVILHGWPHWGILSWVHHLTQHLGHKYKGGKTS